MLFADQLRYARFGLLSAIREELGDVSIIVYFQDLVSKDADKQWMVDQGRASADLVLSFDRSDAARFDLGYHIIPYSRPSAMLLAEDAKFDVCFVGQAKDRLPEIVHVLERLNEIGCRCFFYVTGVEPGDRISVSGLHFGDPLTYCEYLEYIAQSECLLEIVQHGGGDSTIRLSEAIAFNKLLLSNSPLLESNPHFDSERMIMFTSADAIDGSLVETVRRGCNPYSFDISPEAFLDDLADMLDGSRLIVQCNIE